MGARDALGDPAPSSFRILIKRVGGDPGRAFGTRKSITSAWFGPGLAWFGLVWFRVLMRLVQGIPALTPGLAMVWPGLASGPRAFGTRKSNTSAWFGLVLASGAPAFGARKAITPAWFGLVWPLALVHLVQGRPSLPPGLACLGLACVCGCMRVYRRHHAASHWRSESPPLRIWGRRFKMVWADWGACGGPFGGPRTAGGAGEGAISQPRCYVRRHSFAA